MNFKQWFLTINENINDLLPQISEILQNEKSELVGIHFSNGIVNSKTEYISNILSRNIKPSHSDPIGVYVFPKKYVFETNLYFNPMFTEMKYVYVLKPNNNAKILNLDMTEEKAKKLLKLMEINENYYNDPRVYHKSVRRDKMTPGHIFWGCLELYKNENKLSKNYSWNVLFRKTDYNVLYDPGLKLIHHNEPSQIVYLENNTYDILFSSRNTQYSSVLSKFIKSFPEYKVKKDRSFQYNKRKQISHGTYFFTLYNKYFKLYISEHLNLHGVTAEYDNYILSYHINKENYSSFSYDNSKTIYNFVNIDELIVKLKELLNGNKDIYQNHEPFNSLLYKISKLYKLKSEPARIIRTYRKKIYDTEYVVSTIIYISTNYNADNPEKKLAMRFYSFPKKTAERSFYSNRIGYDITIEVPITIDASPAQAINKLFDAAFKKIENLDDDYWHSKQKYMSYDLSIIRKKTFPPKPE